MIEDEQTRQPEDVPAPGPSETSAETPRDVEVSEVPALHPDDPDPDSLAGDFTDPDVDVDSLLEVTPDEDGE